MSEGMPRRSFMELAGSVIMLGSSADMAAAQLSADIDTDVEGGDELDVYGLVLGSRPGQDKLDAEWDTYRLVHISTDTGVKSYITHASNGWQEIPMPNPTTQVDELRVTQFESFFNHTFARPEAPDTKNWSFDSADVTKQGAEVELASTTSLTSDQRGNYPPGSEAIPGVAFRVTDAITAGECFAGYFIDDDDDQQPDDGFGFGMDTQGTFTFLAKDGSLRKVYQDNWNGVGVSEDPFLRHWPQIARFPHLFYGGGSIAYRIVDHESTPATKLKTVHTETPLTAAESGAPFNEGPPISQPNLPVNFVSNGLTGGSLRANASHYERGLDDGETRVNGEHFNITGITTSDWAPIISWRKRSGWDMVNVKPLLFNTFAATNDLKLELQLGAVLDTPSFSLPTHTSSSETAVEVFTGGTIATDGERRAISSAAAGQGSQFGQSGSRRLTFNLAADETVTLAAQSVGGNADAFGHLEWEEFF